MSRERATKTEAEYLAERVEEARKREESFQRCDTDGFLSQWAHDQNSVKNAHLAALARNEGRILVGVYVDRETGEPVPARGIRTRYGYRIATFATWGECCSRGAQVIEWISEKKADERYAMAYFETEGAVDSYAARGSMNVHYRYVPFRGYILGLGTYLPDNSPEDLTIVDDPRGLEVQA